MRRTQDRLPTHKLSGEMALDSQGRVLRRPHFLTRSEHDREMTNAAKLWAGVVTHETGNVNAERNKVRLLTEKLNNPVLIPIYPKIVVRKRLHWMVKRLIQIT